MVGGKSRREGVPVKRSSWSNTRKVLHRRDSLFWRVWKRPQKEMGRKTFGWIFQHTENQKTPKSHWGKWMSYMNENEGPPAVRVGYIYKTTVIWLSWPNINTYTSNRIKLSEKMWLLVTTWFFFSRGECMYDDTIRACDFLPNTTNIKSCWPHAERRETPITLESEK